MSKSHYEQISNFLGHQGWMSPSFRGDILRRIGAALEDAFNRGKESAQTPEQRKITQAVSQVRTAYEAKQVIVMRTDLGMRKGKMIAQGAHASMKVLLERRLLRLNGYRVGDYLEGAAEFGDPMPEDTSDLLVVAMNDAMKKWLDGAFAKICVRADSEEELLAIYQKAVDAGVVAALVTDQGRTEFKGVPTNTCCAIGPAPIEVVDAITGDLKLL